MKLINDQIKISWSNFSCVFGVKDKLHTNIIFAQNEI